MFDRFQRARRERSDLGRLVDDCRKLLTERGESNSVAIAMRAIGHYRRLTSASAKAFFETLAREFDPDPAAVVRLAERYAAERSPQALIELSRAAEPPRQELLRRLNRAPEGTGTIVAMRAQLLQRLRTDAGLRAVDADFEHLLSSWFNPGFLRLEQVDWSSPALLLEKIIQHEAVHAIDGWADLRRRLEPDRRCFAFFHPVLPQEPLIFVEVALLDAMPAAIAPLLDRTPPVQADATRFKVAAFYSISNCQPGLRGINLGNFLIKRVAQRLQQEFPRLRTFCTLSPIPSFADWLAGVERIASERVRPAVAKGLDQALAGLRARHGVDLAGLGGVAGAAGAGDASPPDAAAARDDADLLALRRLCAFYLMHTSAGDQNPSDPVARFHLNNGASLERINVRADLSKKGVRQSHGLMVNYLYDLERIEANHEQFLAGEEIAASRAVRGLL